jgi:hypothetical protein
MRFVAGGASAVLAMADRRGNGVSLVLHLPGIVSSVPVVSRGRAHGISDGMVSVWQILPVRSGRHSSGCRALRLFTVPAPVVVRVARTMFAMWVRRGHVDPSSALLHTLPGYVKGRNYAR